MDKYSKRLLRFDDVQRAIPLSRSYIYYLISQDRFPHPVKIVKGGRGAGWWEHDIQEYLNERFIEESTGIDDEY